MKNYKLEDAKKNIGELVTISLSQVCRLKIVDENKTTYTSSIDKINDENWKYVPSSYEGFYKKIWLVTDVCEEASITGSTILYFVLRSSCPTQYIIKVYTGNVEIVA